MKITSQMILAKTCRKTEHAKCAARVRIKKYDTVDGDLAAVTLMASFSGREYLFEMDILEFTELNKEINRMLKFAE